jgi:hypothetical protein
MDNTTPHHQLRKPGDQNQADRSRWKHMDLKADSQEQAQSKWSTESQPENLREPIDINRGQATPGNRERETWTVRSCEQGKRRKNLAKF